MRFLAFPRLERCGFARHGGFHAAAAFRPRVFTTPRRFPPRDALRVYFTPLARLGFPLQGFSPSREPFLLSEAVALLPLSPSLLSLAGTKRRRPGFRALLPLEVRCSTASG
jgi:hypothetical protein